jgi:N-acetylglucosaminyldiphosphoundecaprenol N-acetyl-beta-D-mannosaminyltransferase
MRQPECEERRKWLRVRCSAGEPRANVLGVTVSAISMSDAVSYSDRLLQSDAQGYICVTGVHGIMEAQSDKRFRAILNASFLTTPDGMPTVWVGQLQGLTHMSRVSGPEYMLEMCRLSVERGYKHFLYGGKPGVADDLKRSLSERFPGLRITGAYTPPFRPLTAKEEIELERQVREAQADILWCGISTPKQERFMEKYCGRLPVKLMIGVGAAFDIHSGRAKDGPEWVKNVGMNWLWRMLGDPRRLARRYLRNNPRFLWRISLQFAGIRKYLALKPVIATMLPDAVTSNSTGPWPATNRVWGSPIRGLSEMRMTDAGTIRGTTNRWPESR